MTTQSSKSANKLELFEQYDGKRFEIAEGEYIVCNLKRSWSREKMQQTIEEWEADVEVQKSYQDWRREMFAHAESLHYSKGETECRAGSLLTLRAFQTLGFDDDIRLIRLKQLEERLFALPSDHQWKVVETLTKPSDRHVRLYGDGRIAASIPSEGNWHVIQLDGSHSPLDQFPSNTTLSFQHTLVNLSDDMDVEVQVAYGSLSTQVYFHKQYKNPTWYAIQVLQRTTQESPIVLLGGYGELPIELATQAALGLTLAIAIAQDFKTFLDNPHLWLSESS